MEKFFNEKCGLLYWNADLMWTFLSKKVHMWTFGAKCGPIWQHCLREDGKHLSEKSEKPGSGLWE